MVGLTTSVAGAKLVACVGDSITYGAGIAGGQRNAYPAQLARILQQVDIQWETRNFGVNAATLLRKGSKPYFNLDAYSAALASEPEVVIVLLGTNDSEDRNWAHKDDFIPDYLALIDAFAQLPNQPKIFVCYPPPLFSITYSLRNIVIRDEIIPLIEELPTYRAVEVIDLYTPLVGADHMFPDTIHPNAEGSKLMAEVIASVLTGVRANPDFNGDGIVDCADICLMVNYWHTNEPAYDIAPPPFGDGIVDVQDLSALAEYLLTYPGAVAYWKLDETEGIIAHDSVGDNDAFLMGDPAWQPDGGIVDGALQLDGVGDRAITGSIPNPAEGPFSVFVWIKGGAPGQAVLSQIGGVNWLCADKLEGNLMTELKATGRGTAALLSQMFITDGNWHRIGLVWDGSHRTLYVDDIAVAEDAQTNLAGSENGLYIGTGKAMEPGSFWAGLIDDVRIYNRAVTP